MRYIITLTAIPTLLMIGWYYGSLGTPWYEFLLLILIPIAMGVISGFVRSKRQACRREEFGKGEL